MTGLRTVWSGVESEERGFGVGEVATALRTVGSGVGGVAGVVGEGGELVEEGFRIVGDEEGGEGVAAYEVEGGGVIEECQERVKVVVDVEDADWFMVETESAPGEDLEEFLESSDPAREGEEGLGEFGHECFALVHAVDDVKLGEAVVSDFPFGEFLRDDTHHAASGC